MKMLIDGEISKISIFQNHEKCDGKTTVYVLYLYT